MTQIFEMVLQILVDGPMWKRDEPVKTAILILPGIQEYRITEGVKLWPSRGLHLWVAGTRGDPAYTREQIVEAAGADSPHILHGGFANHTREQMEWCRDLLVLHSEVKHLVVSTAAYHLPRCVLTLVQTMYKAGILIPISPRPLRNPDWNSFAGLDQETIQSEMERIERYQQQGDVASCEIWRDYLQWRLDQPMK